MCSYHKYTIAFFEYACFHASRPATSILFKQKGNAWLTNSPCHGHRQGSLFTYPSNSLLFLYCMYVCTRYSPRLLHVIPTSAECNFSWFHDQWDVVEVYLDWVRRFWRLLIGNEDGCCLLADEMVSLCVFVYITVSSSPFPTVSAFSSRKIIV